MSDQAKSRNVLLYRAGDDTPKKRSTFFLAGLAVSVKIKVDSRLNPRTHPVSTIVYKICLKHADFQWEVYHRFKNFTMLHTRLSMLKAKEHIRKGVARGFSNIIPTQTIPNLPRFPGRPDTLMTSDQDTEDRRAALEIYLNQLLILEFYRETQELVDFLEVSELSFLSNSVKGKETWIHKRRGDDAPWKNRWRDCLWCHDAFSAHISTQWNKRWLIVQDTYVMYVNPDTGAVKCVLLFDRNFEARSGFRKTGSRKCVILENLSRSLYLKSSCRRGARHLINYINKVIEQPPAGVFLAPEKNRFESFAPKRRGLATWYVDGADYMNAVADAIIKAKEEIYITDWWLSPDLYLKRGKERKKWELTDLLRGRAELGVQVSILIYKEIPAVLSINSTYTKQRLLNHPNIRVARHPDHAPIPSMWAHHEKMVVIDQEVAFLGGIDLCFGRWDTYQHRLTDVARQNGVISDQSKAGPLTESPGGVGGTSNLTNSSSLTNLKIINSTRPIVVEGVRSVTALLLQQHGVLDLAVGPALHGLCEESAQAISPDAQKDTISEMGQDSTDKFSKSARSVVIKMKTIRQFRKKAAKQAKGKDSDSVSSLTMDDKVSKVRSTLETDGAKGSAQQSANTDLTWPGKDYINWIVRDMFQPELAEQDNADRLTTPRMPWHDIGVGIAGIAARDVARHFIQRWNAVKREKLKQNSRYPILVPKAYPSIDSPINPYYSDLVKFSINVSCQVVRSCSEWSAGQSLTEHSIHTAMIDTIENAKHYVYIENQFYISFVKSTGSEEVKNGISTAIFNRIVRAKQENEIFRVYILLPLLPALEGDVAGDTGIGMRAIMHYQYKSIARGNISLIHKLIDGGVNDWQNYIGFYSLRGRDELQGIPVSELIYIHSKLLIADDCRVICSSANINDRSLLGDRDSEVGVVIDDIEFVEGEMNGERHQGGKFGGGLRRQLFREHLGLFNNTNRDIDISDPISDEFFHGKWNSIANSNTRLYEELFSVLPSDTVSTRKDSKQIQLQHRPLVETFTLGAKPSLAKLQGNLVKFPMEYLKDENLQPPTTTKEGLVSSQLWT